jgi:predicted kinase
MKVWIYCGLPGAGKTTRIKRDHPHAVTCSADDFFMQGGEYRFDVSKLSEAHGSCLRNFVSLLQDSMPQIVVDNTNTTTAEVAPYAALAQAHGYALEIVTVACPPEAAHARNVHGVPLAAVNAMSDRLAKRELPPWWPHRTVEALS